MNYLTKLIILNFISLLLSIDGFSGALIPIGSDEFDFLYETFERKETQAPTAFDYQLAPYLSTNNRFNHSPLSFLGNDRKDKMNLFIIGNENFSSEKHSRSTAYESIRGGITLSPFNNIFVYSDFSLDQEKVKDSSYTGKKWRGLAGGMEQSFLMYHSNIVDITIGRFKSFWGIQKSLVLSGSNALDGLSYNIRWGKIVLSYRLAKLNQIDNVLDSNLIENRYFAGHRLDLHINDRLRIGLFETVIYGGSGRSIEFNYLNPILFFHADQLNDDVNDNTFLGFDFTYFPIRGLKLYGQFLVDDYQLDKKSQGDQEPNEYAFIIGGYLAKMSSSYDFRVEYVRVTNRTYNQVLERNQYLYKGTSIAFFNNNDFDQVRLKIAKWINPFLKVGFNYFYTRQGEGKILDEWTQPWLAVQGNYQEPFPTGIVEKQHKISSQLKGFFVNHFFLDFEVGIMFLKNMRHIEFENTSLKFGRFSLSTYFSTII